MEVIFKSLAEVDRRDGQNWLRIDIDGKKVFEVYDGEPEDNTLTRNFNDCWKIKDLLEKVYQAGLRGRTLDMSTLDVGIEDI